MRRKYIGSSTVTDTRKVWFDGIDYDQLRQSQKNIFAKIDLLQSQASVTTDKESDYYNSMDKLYTCYKAVENFGDDTEMLKKAGAVINDKYCRGLLNKDFGDLSQRNEYINSLIKDVIEQTVNYSAADKKESKDITTWWQTNVLDKNYYKDITGETRTTKPVNPVTIGAASNDLVNKFKDGALSFAYAKTDWYKMTTPSDTIIYKTNLQTNSLNTLANIRAGISSQEQNAYISSKIINRFGVKDVTAFTTGFFEGKYDNIALTNQEKSDLKSISGIYGPKCGFLLTSAAIVTIVTLAIGALTAYITLLQKRDEELAQAQLSQDHLEAMRISTTDKVNKYAAQQTTLNSMGKYVLLGCGVYLLANEL